MAAVLALSAWVRVDSYTMVLGSGELAPQADGDSSYHLRRIEETVRRFPHVPHFDPEMNWPQGAFIPWADGFDLTAAAFALASGGGDPLRRRVAIALWPALLGVLTVWAAIRLVRTVYPAASWRGAALAAGLTTAFLPELVYNSRFGRIDHHVVEALVLTLLATWALKRLPGHPAARRPPALRYELEGALVSGLAVWAFSGSPLYVAVAAVPLVVAASNRGDLEGSGGPGLVAGGVLAAVLSLPAVMDHHHLLSFKFPSMLQPLLLVAAGAAILVCAWSGGSSGRRGRRLALGAGGLAVAAALVAAVAPGAVGEVRGAITGWLLHQDPWLAGVREFRPLLRATPAGGTPQVHLYWEFGWTAFAMPLALPLVALASWRRERGRWLLWFVAAAIGLSLVQVRFGRVAVPLLGAVVGLAVALPFRWLGRRRRWAAAAPAPALLLLATFCVDAATLRFLVRPPRGDLDPALEVAFDLRDHPPPAGLARGLLSNWTYGHQLHVQSGLPVIVNGFGSYLDEDAFWPAARIWSGGADPFDEYLAENQVGTVVAGALTIGAELSGADDELSFKGGGLNQPYMESLPLSPLLIAGSAVPGWGVRHLQHLMPRYASSGTIGELAFRLPALWSFERVKGAAVQGRTVPGQRVLAELQFTEHRRPHTYKAFTEADVRGDWALILPFPSGLIRNAFRSAPRWTISSSGGPAVEFEVPEAAVRAGTRIDLGTLPEKP